MKVGFAGTTPGRRPSPPKTGPHWPGLLASLAVMLGVVAFLVWAWGRL